MPNRIIKDSILTSETVGGLDDFAFRLFVSLICLADDYGRGRAHPAIIKGQAFPFRDVTVERISQGMRDLEKVDSIRLYVVNGSHYYYFPSWTKHQSAARAKTSKWPAPEEADEQQMHANASICSQMIANASICSQMSPNTKTNTNTKSYTNTGAKTVVTPTVEDVKKACQEKGYATDPDKFWSYYQARNWKIQGEPIADWRALLKYWASGDKKESVNDPGHFDDLADWVQMSKTKMTRK